MKAKRIISIATAAIVTVGLVGCGNSKSTGSSSATQAASEQGADYRHRIWRKHRKQG